MKKLVLIVILGVVGCQPAWNLEMERRTDHVVAVFMNTPEEYVIVVKDGNKLVPKTIYGERYGLQGKVDIFDDVPDGEQCWAVVRSYRSSNGGTKDVSEIHVHGVGEIQGGSSKLRRMEND